MTAKAKPRAVKAVKAWALYGRAKRSWQPKSLLWENGRALIFATEKDAEMDCILNYRDEADVFLVRVQITVLP